MNFNELGMDFYVINKLLTVIMRNNTSIYNDNLKAIYDDTWIGVLALSGVELIAKLQLHQ